MSATVSVALCAITIPSFTHRYTYDPIGTGPIPARGNVTVPLVRLATCALNVWLPVTHCQSTYPFGPLVPTGNNPIQPPPGPLLNATVSGPAPGPVVCPGVSVGPVGVLVNLAFTKIALVIETVQEPVPEHGKAPDPVKPSHPVKVDPASGVAVRVTIVPNW